MTRSASKRVASTEAPRHGAACDTERSAVDADQPVVRSDGRGSAADKPGNERSALAWAHTARFLTTASRLPELPPSRVPEVAFVGRSNAGKSTAINTLAQHKRLAFASRTPGRTQHINLFALGPKDAPDAWWADLPGYGYAAVERAAKWRWQEVMADYLATRRGLVGVVMLVDSRLGLTDLDLRLLEWIGSRVGTGEVRLLVLLTKADKLSRKASQTALTAVQTQLGAMIDESADVSVALFSALARIGLEDVAMLLRRWAHEGTAEVAPGAVGDEARNLASSVSRGGNDSV